MGAASEASKPRSKNILGGAVSWHVRKVDTRGDVTDFLACDPLVRGVFYDYINNEDRYFGEIFSKDILEI